MKKKMLLFFLIGCFHLFSQEKFSREIRILSDNDLYTSTFNDRYYTNGLFLSYKYLANTYSEKLSKKIIEWEIGHEMFSPYKAVLIDPKEHDRPFAAYLYGSLSYHFVFKNHQNLKTTVQLGAIGKNAFGQELQNIVHDIYGFKRAIGWDYQIRNALGLNFNVAYLKHLGMGESKLIDFNLTASSRIGSIYTDVSLGFFSRIGFTTLTDIANSLAFETNINNQNTKYKRQVESFIYVKPLLHTVFYDATLEGSFLNTESPITKEPLNLRLEVEVGLKFTADRFNFGYAINFQTNKTDNLRNSNGNKFGRILISYLIH